MLIDPVRGEPALDALPVALLAALSRMPLRRQLPLAVDLVVVEDHRRGEIREQPAHERIAPCLPVGDGIFRVVAELRWAALATAPGDHVAQVRRELIGVELVAEHEEMVRPLRDVLMRHLPRQRAQGVDAVSLLDRPALLQPRRFVGKAGAAGAEHELRGSLRVDGADDARAGRILGRPDRLAVEPHVIGMCAPRIQAGHHDQGVVMPVDAEGVRPLIEHLGARRVRLHPDRRVVEPGVPEYRSQQQARHTRHGKDYALGSIRDPPCHRHGPANTRLAPASSVGWNAGSRQANPASRPAP